LKYSIVQRLHSHKQCSRFNTSRASVQYIRTSISA